MGRLAAARSRPGRARPIPRPGKMFASHRPGSTTIPSGIRATRATSAATAGRRRGDSGGDGETGRRIALPALGERGEAAGCAARRGRSRRARRAAPATARRSAAAARATCCQCRAISSVSRDRAAQLARVDLLDEQAHRARARGRRPGASASAEPSPPPRRIGRPAVSSRSSGSIAGGRRLVIVDRSSAPPIRSSSSGSPTGISRGSSRPPPLARTKASVTARTARLLGSRMRPARQAQRVLAEARGSVRRQARRRTSGATGW